MIAKSKRFTAAMTPSRPFLEMSPDRIGCGA
jgi:hypothetical protein